MSVECALSSPVRHIDMKNTDIDNVILEKSISIRHVSKKREPKNPVTVFFYRTQVNLGSDLWVRMFVRH